MVKAKKTSDVLDLDDHSSEEESRTVFLVGVVEEDLIKAACEKIVTLSEKNPKKPIHLVINTFGGSVYDAFMLYDLIKFVQTPVHTIGLGKIMSAGCLLLAAGTKGKRKLGRNARVMYHAGWDISAGTVWEMKANLEEFEKMETLYDQRFADETGMTLEEVGKLYDKDGPTKDTFISAERALELKIVDELI